MSNQIPSINKEFAVSEFIRLNCKYWDIYSGEGSGLITCNQNPELSIEQSAELLKNSLNNIHGHKVRLKASPWSREDKSKNPTSKNLIDCTVVLQELKQINPTITPNEMFLMLMREKHELEIKLLTDKFEREKEVKPSQFDNISGLILNDPQIKLAFIGLLNKLAGNAPISKPEPINEFKVNTELKEVDGVPIKIILDKLVQISKDQPGAIKQVLNTL